MIKIINLKLIRENGDVKLYVNNVGKVIETVQGKQAYAGDDVYLTIDADLQLAAYNILEQELAGIILSNLRNTLTYDRTTAEDASERAETSGGSQGHISRFV